MRFLAVLLVGLACAAQADEAPLRPSARLLFKQPEMLRTGQCVRYEEGGAGWVMRVGGPVSGHAPDTVRFSGSVCPAGKTKTEPDALQT